MLIFEILYKNPSILQPNPLFELEAGEGAQERLGRGVFRSAIQVSSLNLAFYWARLFCFFLWPGCLHTVQQASAFGECCKRG